MEESIAAKIIAKGLTRLFVDLPLTILVLRLWVWGRINEVFDLPTLTWPQTVGVSLLILIVVPI